MESSVSVSPAGELIGFVKEVVDWTQSVSDAYLDDRQIALLAEARTEIEAVQLPRIEQQLRSISDEELAAAGFTEAQTAFKLESARTAMDAAARGAESPWPGRRKKILDVLDFVVENVQTILGSLKSLSVWIDAASELVGVAASGAKAAVAEKGVLRRTYRKVKRRIRDRRERQKPEEEPEDLPPAVAG